MGRLEMPNSIGGRVRKRGNVILGCRDGLVGGLEGTLLEYDTGKEMRDTRPLVRRDI